MEDNGFGDATNHAPASPSVHVAPLTPSSDSARPRLIPLSGLLDDWDAQAEELYEARQTGRPRGPVTGLARLDTEIGGALLPGVHIAHGVPGVGKTAFVLQIAAACQCPCLYVTCEMNPLELLRRLTARTTGKYLGKFKTGELSPQESGKLVRQTIQATPFLAILDATTAYASPENILEAAEATRTLLPHSPHFLLVLDSLHSWADASDVQGEEYDRISEGVSALRQIAARLTAPVLAIAERNRASMKSGGLSAAAGSRKVEYGAETVFDLDCGEDAQVDSTGEIPVTLRIRKNRNGAKGKKLDLRFHGALQKYREAEDGLASGRF